MTRSGPTASTAAPAPHRGRAGFLRERLSEPPLADARSRRNRVVIALVMVVASLVLFVRVWDWWTEREDLSRWDVPALTWLTEHRDPVLTGVLEVVTTLTAPTGMIIICAVTVPVWLLGSRHWWRPVLLAGAMAVAVACIVGIKSVAGRGRPPVADMLMGADLSYSFPSGHTLATSTFVLVLLYLVYFRPYAEHLMEATGAVTTTPHGPSAARPPARWWVVAAGIAVIAVVAFSRLYLGYHWLTDVTASLLLAVAVLGLVVGVDAWRPTARLTPVAPHPQQERPV
ncbi:phosphatase PAP2 family protein [Kocuria rhizophila]|uniref:phosphatase PAP2 family protein n=1 Tax=Kocuria rhizophila TaxID=72000 RepID=UPI0009D76B91|nr:phosphatase PAP2 family protein [Kocuria rhizophila]ASE11869.1 PAP2 family protein [Kocuria rhizophila]VEH74340.1 PAP2 (acid phosphatase) superfamily protein [Kocuria rhizophila]